MIADARATDPSPAALDGGAYRRVWRRLRVYFSPAGALRMTAIFHAERRFILADADAGEGDTPGDAAIAEPRRRGERPLAGLRRRT